MHSRTLILVSLAGLGLAGCSLVAPSAPGPSRFGATHVVPPALLASSALVPAPLLATGPRTLDREAAAIAVLERRVVALSHPEALRIAFRAYWNFRSAHPEQVENPYFYFVDYGLHSSQARGYVFDMDALDVVEGPFPVAHGRGSARRDEGVPTRFTNVQNSATTSLGLYVAEETYAFSGTSSGTRYRSIGLRLRGVSGKFNSAARRRGIVVHGAPYVTASGAGRSEGCPAMEPERATRLIPLIAKGGLVFHFSPADARWMQEDPWIGRPVDRMASRRDVGSAE